MQNSLRKFDGGVMALSPTAASPGAPGFTGGIASFTATALSPGTVEWYRSRGVHWLREHATITWERPDRGFRVFGLGTAARFTGMRGEGFAACHAYLQAALTSLREAAGNLPFAPMAFAAGSFDPANPRADRAWDAFGGWQVVVPAITVVIRGDQWSGIACAGDFPADAPATLAEADAPDPVALEQAIAEAVREIRSDRYQKVVLAGSRTYRAPRVAPAEILGRLGDAFPTCCVFSWRSGGLTWLGASPEPLAACRDGSVDLVSLAGSRRRGSIPPEDLALERELLASPKERWEHQLVVDAIRSEVADLVTGLDGPDEPTVMKLANIQHLYTPLRARLLPGAGLLDVVRRLHPTPAVGGWPRPEALDAIRRLERLDRGWYAGPIGWIDPAGNGEFVVGLRTALVGDGLARLYAGAGIVADSEPAAELEEIETKLDALRGVIVR